MSGFVRGLAVFDCFFSIFIWRNIGCDFLLCEYLANFVADISPFPNQGSGFGQILEKDISSLEVAALAFRQM